MLLPIDMNFAARKVHFLQYEGPKFEPVGNFTVPLPCVHSVVVVVVAFIILCQQACGPIYLGNAYLQFVCLTDHLFCKFISVSK